MTLFSGVKRSPIWRALVKPSPLPEATPFESPTRLTPLGPVFEPEVHVEYVSYLQAAITGPQSDWVRNIALTGAYGTGKSSILRAFMAAYPARVVHISLSALGAAAENVEREGEQPPMGMGSGEEDNSLREPVATSGVTNAIQKEIVKQLLYSTSPANLPGSRYRRIAPFYAARGAGIAVVAGLTIAALVGVFGWSTTLNDVWASNWGAGLILYGGFAILVAAVTYAAIRYAHNRWTLEKVGTASTTIALTGVSGSYFDAYLDEIVHFFDRTSRNIVVFEDLDRFSDTTIFETLRALNTLLNTAVVPAPQPIRFIYAVRDSVFAGVKRDGNWGGLAPQFANTSAMAVAERTKFFDLIVPVVPFITHQNARDLLEQELKRANASIEPRMIRLVGRYLTDMRLVRNICNEFAVFSHRVLREDGLRDLRPEGLLAMIIYKNTELADFEKVVGGISSLDVLYQAAESYRSVALKEAEDSVEVAQRQVAVTPSDEEVCRLRGDVLVEAIDEMLKPFGQSRYVLEQDGVGLGTDDLRSLGFWTRIDSTGPLIVRPIYMSETIELTRSYIAQILDDADLTLIPDAVAEAQQQLDVAIGERARIRFATIADLLKVNPSVETTQGAPEKFTELVNRLFQSQLAREMIEQGYLDENFNLYVSEFHGVSVSARVMNFIVHTVRPNDIAPDYAFSSPGDVDVLLEEIGVGAVSDRSLLNVEVYDRIFDETASVPLLRTAQDLGARRLAIAGSDEEEFLRRYFAVGKRQAEVMAAAAGHWNGAFTFVSGVLGEHPELEKLMNAALQGSSPNLRYSTSAPLRAFLDANAGHLGALAVDGSKVGVGTLLRTLGVKLSSLSSLGASQLREVVASRAFVINAANLRVAAGTESIALDKLWGLSDLRDYILDSLDEYIQTIDSIGDQSSIDDPAQFVDVLTGINVSNASAVPEIVQRASDDCYLEDLSAASPELWPAIAENSRMAASHSNIVLYVDAHSVDTKLANAIEMKSAISADDAVPQAERESLAVRLLNADVMAPKMLVARLRDYTDGPLPVARVTSSYAETFTELVAAGLIEDDRVVFDNLRSRGWKFVEAFMAVAVSVPDYVATVPWTAAEIENFAESQSVDQRARDALIQGLGQHAAELTSYSAPILLERALEGGLLIDAAAISSLQAHAHDVEGFVTLIARSLDKISDPELHGLLRNLGGEYERATEYAPGTVHWPKTDASATVLRRLAAGGPISRVFDDPDQWRATRRHDEPS